MRTAEDPASPYCIQSLRLQLLSRVDEELKALWIMELKKPVENAEDANSDGAVDNDNGDFEPVFDFDD